MITLKPGDLCYFETVRDGLVPCRYIGPRANPADMHALPNALVLKATGNRGAYKAGDMIETTARHAIPRAAVMRRRYKTLILPYEVEH